MSSEDKDDGQTILQNKEISQLLAFANFDIKQNKTAIMKINIKEALGKVHLFLCLSQDALNRATDEVDLRIYGNILFAITRGMNKQMGYIVNDLREAVENIRKVSRKYCISNI